MDLGTLREQIKRTTSRTSASADHHIDAAITRSIRKYYRKRFRWNQLEVEMALNGERTERSPSPTSLYDGADYYYPMDLLRSQRLRRLNWAPNRPIDEYSMSTLTQRFSSTVTGIPQGMAWDGETLVVRPGVEPGYPVTLSYLRDIGRPEQVIDDGVWIMRNSITKAKMNADAESPWFDEAQDLIHWQSVYDLSMGVYGDTEMAQRAAAMVREVYKELKGSDQMTSEARAAKAHY